MNLCFGTTPWVACFPSFPLAKAETIMATIVLAENKIKIWSKTQAVCPTWGPQVRMDVPSFFYENVNVLQFEIVEIDSFPVKPNW